MLELSQAVPPPDTRTPRRAEKLESDQKDGGGEAAKDLRFESVLAGVAPVADDPAGAAPDVQDPALDGNRLPPEEAAEPEPDGADTSASPALGSAPSGPGSDPTADAEVVAGIEAAAGAPAVGGIAGAGAARDAAPRTALPGTDPGVPAVPAPAVPASTPATAEAAPAVARLEAMVEDDAASSFSRAKETGAAERPGAPAETGVSRMASVPPAPAGSGPVTPAGPGPDPAAPVRLSIAVPLDAAAWQPEVASRLTWMIRRDVQMADLDVNPPQLGPIQIRLAVHGDQAQITFTAQHALARDAIDQSLDRLREALGDSGFTRVDVDVRHDAPEGDREQLAAGPGHADGGGRGGEPEPILGAVLRTPGAIEARLVDQFV